MKNFVSFFALSAVVVSLTGCSMCTSPISGEDTCIEKDHYTEVQIRPNALSLTKPNLAGSRELFRPVFKAGSKRVTVVGEGLTRDIARNDAIAKFLATANCDYIVGVTTIVKTKTHPTWRLFSTTNYSVTLSGIPIHLDKLSCETVDDKKAAELAKITTDDEAKPETPAPIVVVKEETKTKHECKQNPALIKLSDIDVRISAKGSTDDKAGVIFPLKEKKETKSVSTSIIPSNLLKF